MRNRRHVYLWLVPLAWTACSLLSFQFPGDEYGLYASIPLCFLGKGVVWGFGRLRGSRSAEERAYG